MNLSPPRLLSNVVHLLVHLIRRLNHFAVGLVGALAGDHVDELLHHTDVRGFHITLLQGAHALLAPGIANRRIAGRVGRQEQPAPDAVQTAGVDKVGQLDLAGYLRSGLAWQAVTYCPIGRDGDRLRLRWNRNLRLDRIAVAGHHVAVAIELEIAGACVRDLPVGLPDLKKSLALNHHIERVVGLLKAALRKYDGVGRRPRSETELEAARDHSLRARRRAGLQKA